LWVAGVPRELLVQFAKEGARDPWVPTNPHKVESEQACWLCPWVIGDFRAPAILTVS
jgi:hypothetical protein